jgi:hypothetical protein
LFNFKRTRKRLFQKLVVRTKFGIYVFFIVLSRTPQLSVSAPFNDKYNDARNKMRLGHFMRWLARVFVC